MRISDREIENSFKFLGQDPIDKAEAARRDREIERMVFIQLKDMPDIRMERVVPLRAAILQNRYSVPSEDIAQKILGRCLADHIR